MRIRLARFLFVLLASALTGGAAEPRVTPVAAIPAGRHPQILYWFFKADSVAGKTYRADLDRIAQESPFSLIILTSRGGPSFYDPATTHPIFADLVEHAHALGLKVGLQLFAPTGGATRERAQGLVEETLCRLDEHGAAAFDAVARNTRSAHNNAVIAREVLAAYAFRPAGDGRYDPASLKPLSPADYVADASDPAKLAVHLKLGPAYAGYAVYVMTVHYFPYGDVFSSFFEESFGNALAAYRDIPFDGTALDEFGTLRISRTLDRDREPWSERWYSDAFARFYEEKTGTTLRRALFDMRYAPRGDDTVRVAAINHYFDLWRAGVLKVERAFYAKSKELFGPGCFAGVHDTFHNRLTNDEYWATGINWWAIPREYGQTDEDTPMPTRFGIALGHPEKIPYNMFYDRSVRTILDEAARDTSYNSRVHYHAFNDFPTQWGADFKDLTTLRPVAAVERKVRLLNLFDGPEPQLPVLVVFGFPALTTWYPNDAARNAYDMNGSLGIEEKAAELWDAGYLCALIPSDKIDEGAVRIEGAHRIVYGGHAFSSVVYLYPQYAKEANLAFLEQLRAAGASYLVEGAATRDFTGADITARFAAIRSGAAATEFSVRNVARLGAAKNDVAGGCRLVDGSLLVVDHDSFIGGRPAPFDVTVTGHRFTGTFSGLLALKVSPEGGVEKLAASGLQSLAEDGKPLLVLHEPADVVLTGTGAARNLLVASPGPATGSPFKTLILP